MNDSVNQNSNFPSAGTQEDPHYALDSNNTGSTDPYYGVQQEGISSSATPSVGVLSEEDLGVADRLIKAKESKLYALSKRKNGANLDDSYTELEDGRLESNKNKIWNSATDHEAQSLIAYAKNNKALTLNEEGVPIDPEGNPFMGKTRRDYLFGTKVDGSEVVKTGITRGDYDTAKQRYITYPSGSYGADIDKMYEDTLYPNDVAVMLEAFKHGREKALQNRVIKDRYADPEGVHNYGGGSSEYYNSVEGLLGAPEQEVDLELGARLFEEYMAKLPEQYRRFDPNARNDALPISRPNAIENAVKGFGATFVNTLLVSPADALGDLTGLYDLDRDGATSKKVERAFGYDNRNAEEAMEKIGGHWDVLVDENATTTERLRAAANGALEAFVTPEILGTSLGALLSWVTPGTVLKAAGVGAKYANAAKAIDASVKAGEMTKLAGRVAKAKNLMSAEGAKHALAQQSGFMLTAIGNVNNQYEEFVKFNNGKELEGSEKAAWYSGRFAVQMLNQNLDKIVDLNVIKSPGFMKAAVPAVKAMTEKEYGKVLAVMGKGLLATSAQMGSEAAQEYAQTSMELHNARYGAEQFKDLDTYTKFLTNEENVREAGIGALAGAGGAVQFDALGNAVPTTLGLGGIASGVLSGKGTTAPTITQPSVQQNVSEDEVKTAKQEYKTVLARAVHRQAREGVTPKNIESLIDDIETLNSTKHVIADSSPEAKAQGEALYESVLDSIEEFVNTNPSFKFSKRVVRKTLKEAEDEVKAKDEEAKAESLAKVPESTQKAFSDLAEVIGNGSRKDYESSVKSVVNKFKTGKFDTVIPEEGTIDDEVKALELALTGKVSETLEESFDSVQLAVKGKKPESFAKEEATSSEDTLDTSDTAESDLRGSAPFSGQTTAENVTEDILEEFEESDYDDYTRSVLAERIAGVLLGSKRTYSEEFKNKLKLLAKSNNVSEERFNHIVKSYASVDEEAKESPRGYNTRLNRIRSLVSSSNPDEKRIDKEQNDLIRMYSAISASETALKRGIDAANNLAKEHNKSNLTAKNTDQVTTEYEKDPSSYKNARDKFFKINLSKNAEGLWVADTTEAEKRLAQKRSYLKDIDNGLAEIASKTNSKYGITPGNGRVTVPLKEGKTKKLQQKDVSYIKRVEDAVREILPESKGVNKIILGQKTHAKWDPKNDYYKANSSLVNQEGNYSKDDVILLDSDKIVNKSKDKSSTFYVPDFGDTAKKAISEAIEAGASFVLDSSLVQGKQASKELNKALAIIGYFKSKDYELLEGAGRTLLVKKTPENKKSLAEHKEKLAKEKSTADAIKKDKDNLVKLGRSLRSNVSYATGNPLTEKELEVFNSKYDELFERVSKNSFKSVDENVEKFLDREIVEQVEKAAKDIISDPDPDPVSYQDRAFTKAVEEEIARQQAYAESTKATLKEWAEVVKEELPRKEREKSLIKLLESTGLKVKQLVEDLLTTKSFAKGKNDIYEMVLQEVKTGEIKAIPLRKPMTEEEVEAAYAANEGKGHRYYSKKHIFLGVRPVVQDATKLVELRRTTIVNTIPLDRLPSIMQDAVKAFRTAAKKALAGVSPAELEEQTDVRGKTGFLDGNLFLHNSPARGLIYNKDGSVNDEVLAAAYLALGELAAKDKTSLSRGYKSDADVAKMFNVEEFEVTDSMRKFSREYGAPLKTVASSLGKSMMAHLGLGKKKGNDIAAEEYAALVADLGNSVLLIAEKQGLVSTKEVSSNALADLYRDGEVRDYDSYTHFIHLTDKVEKEGDFERNVPTDGVEIFINEYKEVAEEVPEAIIDQKTPYSKPPTEERLKRALENVRNDIAGKEVPEEAKDTLTILMDTKYTFDMERVNEFLDAVDAEGSKVMELLGYVDIENDKEKFDGMFFRDKEVQESINRDIEKSIKSLRDMRDEVNKSGKKEAFLFFDYFYSSNDRYMLDSNTINPQIDKLHRFLVVPAGHNLEYRIGKNANGGLTFEVDENADTEEDKDQSYTVRMALTQAFGGDVDKFRYDRTIAFGDAMLSLSLDQLKEAKEKLLNTGSFEIKTGGPNGITVKAKGDHITHSLQAFNFLEEVKKAEASGTNTFSSTLSLEFDSLTSGFANKVQQMPILDDMHLHLARTGVLTKEYQDLLRDAYNFQGSDVGFDVKLGHSMSDLADMDSLEEGREGGVSYLDSYMALAKETVVRLITGDKQDINLTKSAKEGSRSGADLFDLIKPMLPGGESLSGKAIQIEITKAIRNLFKNPFMIFNYSASIGRIVKNLGINVSTDLVKSIATTDLSNPDNEAVRLVAEGLVKNYTMVNPDTKKDIKTVEELQDTLRNYRLSSIKLKTSLKVHSNDPTVPKDLRKDAKTLEDALSIVVKLTYGEVVKDVFNDSFKPFIKVQEAMNDTYKVAFRIFDKKRVDMLTEMTKKEPNKRLTEEDHAKVLEALWDDFPWIVGPLTGASNKKDVITVVTTTARSLKGVEASRKNPQTMLGEGYKNSSRTVSPLVRYLEEAVSSGSVLPFHAIDGAEMSKMLNELGIKAIAAIHDAVIPPLNKSDIAGFTYQKGMHNTNTTYSLADQMKGLAERIQSTIDKEGFDKEYSLLGVKGLKNADKEDSFPVAAKKVIGEMLGQVAKIEAAREDWYGPEGKMKGAEYGNLVSTPGAMFKEDRTAPDLTYKTTFKPMYKTYKDVSVVDENAKEQTAEEVMQSPATEAIKSAVDKATSYKPVKNLVGKLLNDEGNNVQEVVDALEERVKGLTEGGRAAKEIDKVITVLTSAAADAIIQKDDNNESVADMESMSKAASKSIEDC